jgi:hypothetical protein
MFKKLFQKRSTVKHNQDRIWLSEDQKYAGIMARIATLDQQVTRVVLVAHFPSTFRHLESLLQSTTVTYEPYATPLETTRLATMAEYISSSQVMLVLASVLPSTQSGQTPATTSVDFEIEFIVAEHYPLPSQDDRILLFTQSLPTSSSRLTFHEALDGAFMKRFGGDQVSQLMASLNVPENESLSDQTINKSLRAAQEKLARRITHNLSADSAEQWFQLNMV